MAINQLIASGIQLPRFESPLNMMAQLSQLEAAREANELRRMQMAQMQQRAQQEMMLANALRSGNLTIEQAILGGDLGKQAFDMQQRQLEAQRKQEEAQRLQRAVPFAMAAGRAVRAPVQSPEESDALLMGARQELADLGISGPDIEQKFASLRMLGTPEARRAGLETMVSSIPGLPELLAAREKETAGVEETRAKTRKLNVETARAGQPDLPTSVKETEWLRTASPEQIALFERVKKLSVPHPSRELTPLQKAADEKFAADFNQWLFGGGVNVTKNVAQIGEVLKRLESGKTQLTGPLIGIQPDVVLAVTNPQAVDARQRVEQVAQESLRAILGAQFTQREGEAFIARVYNPSLKPEVNAARLRAMFLQLETAAKQKQAMVDYAIEKGTLVGYKGKMPSIQDFYDAIQSADTKRETDQTTPPSRGTAGGERQPTRGGGATVSIKSDAEYNALPSGTLFTDPEGNVRRKP